MTTNTEMIRSHPDEPRVDQATLTTAVNLLMECSQACTACADACLAEPDVEPLRECIRVNLDCADICHATERVLSRRLDPAMASALIQACILACRSCADECRLHGQMHAHCRLCAEACQRCAEACEALLGSLA